LVAQRFGPDPVALQATYLRQRSSRHPEAATAHEQTATGQRRPLISLPVAVP
jgi:hypothetical protein